MRAYAKGGLAGTYPGLLFVWERAFWAGEEQIPPAATQVQGPAAFLLKLAVQLGGRWKGNWVLEKPGLHDLHVLDAPLQEVEAWLLDAHDVVNLAAVVA